MTPTEKDVFDILALVNEEVLKTIIRRGTFASAHEGHSVIREEMDELWEHVRADTGYSAPAFVEAIQIAAMSAKYALMVLNRLRQETIPIHQEDTSVVGTSCA